VSGNIFEAPRSRPFPLPPLARNVVGTMFIDACRELGHHPFPGLAGILSQNYRDISGRTRSGCIYCGYCTRYGCHVDAKSSAITGHIPVALDSGRYEVRANCKVLRVNIGADRLATGLTYVDANGEEHEQPADIEGKRVCGAGFGNSNAGGSIQGHSCRGSGYVSPSARFA
jgi:gluconate 2-dehydrogenase alpha chain